MLATLQEVKDQLRIDEGDIVSDAALNLLIETASEMVVAYLKTREITAVDDSTSPPTEITIMDLDSSPALVPPRVRQATIMLTGYLYRSPDQNLNNEWLLGEMPRPITSLLYQLRDPTIA
jgi:gp6-like head-tail connector protein